jgi:hypothetical protein
VKRQMLSSGGYSFRKYVDTEFLTRIYQTGSKPGVAVAETTRQETRLRKQGQHGVEHSEEQK